MIAASSEIPEVKASTSESSPASSSLGSSEGPNAVNPRIPQAARSRPRHPEINANVTLSVSNWRTRRPLPAPRAVLIAISRSRVAPHATVRLATFTQAMSKTNETAANKINSANRVLLLNSTRKGTTPTPMSLLRTESVCSKLFARTFISACAC